MKSLLVAFAVTVAATAACNSTTTTTCVTARCGGNAATYQACDNENGTVQYNFSTSCSCTSSDPLGCTTCRASLAAFCGVVLGSSSSGGSGSSSGSSSGGDSGSSDGASSEAGDDGGGDSGSSGDSAGDAGGDAGGDGGGTPADSGGG